MFVRDLLGATNAEFGAMIALFGVGAAGGLGLLSRRRDADLLATVRTGVAAQGAVIVVFSLAPTLAGAFVGAVGFGAAAAFTLAAGMSVLQSRLEDERVLAFTVFHVVIRAGLSVAALGAGIAADLVGGVNWPLVGHLEPERLVLFCAGALVFASSGFVRESTAPERREAWHVRLHRH